MSILVNKNTRLIVQGITGREGMFHAEQMIAYGTNVVGGVTPGKGGQWAVGVPVFDSVRDAVRATEANASIIYVPAAFSPDAIWRPWTPASSWWSASPRASRRWIWSGCEPTSIRPTPG
jgi:succinyl-CoA synthetase alpha subunit